MIAAAMAARTPPVPTYTELAKVGARIERRVAAADCGRLHAAVAEVHDIEAVLDFSFDDTGRASVHGTACATVKMNCQLCDEPVALAINADVDGLLAGSDGEAQAWRSADNPPDIIVVAGAEFDVVELIEDELLLQLPQRVCTDVECEYRPALSYGDKEAETEKANPFQQLAAWRDATDTSGNETSG